MAKNSDTFCVPIDKSVSSLSVDPTGNFVALCGKKPPASSGCIFIIELKDEKKLPQKTFNFRRNSEICHVAWNQLAPNLLASASNEHCEIWDVHNSKIPLQSAFEAHTYNVSDIAWSRFDQNMLATCSSDTMVKQWDIRDPKKTSVHQNSKCLE